MSCHFVAHSLRGHDLTIVQRPSDVTDQAGKVGRLIGVIDRQFAATLIDGQPEMNDAVVAAPDRL